MVRPEPDALLVDRIAQRDPGAFSEFYDLTSSRSFGLILGIVRQRADAEDVLQETFSQVWAKASDYKPALGTPTTWVLMIARSRALDRLRRNKRAAATIEERGRGDGPSDADTDRHEPAEPCGLASSAALDRLPKEQREPIVLAFYRGLTREQIAQSLGLPVGTVKTRIRTGLQRMREVLTESHNAAGAVRTGGLAS